MTWFYTLASAYVFVVGVGMIIVPNLAAIRESRRLRR